MLDHQLPHALCFIFNEIISHFLSPKKNHVKPFHQKQKKKNQFSFSLK